MLFRACVMGLVVAAPLVAPAQVYTFRYAKSWGGANADGFTDVALDSTGNAYAVGFATLSAGNEQLLVVKYSTSGTVLWSRTDIGPISSRDAHIVLNSAGDVFIARRQNASLQLTSLSGSTGATLATLARSFIDTKIDDMKFHAATNSAILLHQASVSTSSINYRVSRYDAVTLGEVWSRSLISNGPPAAKLAVSSDGNIYVARNGGLSTRLQRIDPSNGNILWTADSPHTSQLALDLRVLNGTLNPIVSPSNTNDGVATIFNKNSGSVIRSDTFTQPVAGLMPGLSATYTAVTRQSNTNQVAVFAKGEMSEQGSSSFASTAFVADAAGQAHSAGFLGQTPNALTDLGFIHSASGDLGLSSNSFTSGNALAAASSDSRLVVVGNVTDSVGNMQARVVHVTQNRVATNDLFGYRRNTLLKVPVPGVRANDTLAHNVLVTLVTPPSHGTLTLDTDGSFNYQPNAGSQSQDSFTYQIGPNANDIATVGLNPLTLVAMQVSPSSVVGGTAVEAQLFLTPAPLFPTGVAISDNATGVAFPTSFSFPPGRTSASVAGITVGVAANQNVTVTAALDGVSQTANFMILAATPTALTLNPTTLIGGQSFTGTVTGSGPANSSGYVISITHSGTEITTPINVTMAAGTSSVSFAGTTNPRSTSVTHTVTATARGVSRTANLTLNPGGLFALTVAPTSIKGGTNAQGKIQTAGVAPAGGTLIAVSADGPQITVPPTVTVDAGQQFKTFVVTSTAVSSTTPRTIIASFGTVIKTTTLTLTP